MEFSNLGVKNLTGSGILAVSVHLFFGVYYQIYACFERKTAFVMQNFRTLGVSGGEGDPFDETPKRHILA